MSVGLSTGPVLVCCALGMAAAAVLLTGTAEAGGLRVGPPPAHHDLGDVGSPTSSWLERSVTLANDGYVALEAFVDSQSGADWLELEVDSTVVAHASGFHFAGPIIAPLTVGAHTVRLAFTKDASIDEGLDTAWVDNVRIVDGGRLIEEHDFRNSAGCSIPGWTQGGYGGGWCATFGPEQRQWRSPIEMSYAGYQPGPQSAGISRSITWPSGTDNLLIVDYLVDSEQDHDYFRILVDGTEAFSDSGRLQAGSQAVSVTSGAHVITLEYLKDESVDEGRDQVLLRRIMASSGGKPFFGGGLDGSELGDPAPGWATTGSNPAFQWRATHRPAPRILRSRSDAGRLVDATLSGAEYPSASKTRLQPLVPQTAFEATLAFGANPDGSIALGLELATADVGRADQFRIGKTTSIRQGRSAAIPAGCPLAFLLARPRFAKGFSVSSRAPLRLQAPMPSAALMTPRLRRSHRIARSETERGGR